MVRYVFNFIGKGGDVIKTFFLMLSIAYLLAMMVFMLAMVLDPGFRHLVLRDVGGHPLISASMVAGYFISIANVVDWKGER